MVLGLIGAFIGLPASVCSGACAAGLSAAANGGEAASQSAGNMFLALGLIAVVLAIVGSVMVGRKPKKGGALLMVAFLLTAITCVSLNPLAFIEALLLLVAGILGLVAKPADAPAASAQPPVAPAV
jgi:chromate transport protein ChrA